MKIKTGKKLALSVKKGSSKFKKKKFFFLPGDAVVSFP